jgi:hypothetical protein
MDEDRQALNEKILAGAYLMADWLTPDLADLISSMIQAAPAQRTTLAAIK